MIGFFLCCGAYIFAVFSMWALVYVGSRYDDEMERQWLERITSTPPNNQESQ